MRNQFFITYCVIGSFLMAACGKVENRQMTETEALTEVAHFANNTGSANVSAEELLSLLQDAADRGELKVQQNGRLATGAKLDLSSIATLLATLQGTGGKTGNILTIATGLLSAFGSVSKTGNKLTDIMNIMQAALPIITAIAPQYAGIITAVMTIMPLVMNILSMFGKKPTAAYHFLVKPVFA